MAKAISCICLVDLMIPFLFLLVVHRAFAAGVTDTLHSGRNVTDGETLVSADGTFTLGPLNGTSGVLAISDTGSLVLLDGSGHVAWSSNSPYASSVKAQLYNSGNHVARDLGGNATLWQSFDHPSNTLLPGMKIGKNLWTGAEWVLTSWRSPDDPSPGDYRRVLDTAGLPDVVLWQGGVERYRSGPWNGPWFSGIPADHGPRDICDAYAKCRAFGLCDANAPSTSFCGCLKGFRPTSPAAWAMKNASGGCQRNVALQCGNGTTEDEFASVRGVKLPDTHNASVDMSITVEECRARCLTNCSCLAYAAADIRRGGAGDIIDLRYVDEGQDLYLRLAKSELEGIPQNPATTVPSVDLTKVKVATGNLSPSHGQLPDGRVIAVKRLHQSTLTKKGKKDFTREVEVMARLRHGNLLRLLAYCNEGSERGIANGVAYLHEGSGECVIHRDLKPPNILLDDSFRPKIADFGTAKLFVADQAEPSNLTVVVSEGYTSPEYAWQGEMTLKCDVYSFGVVLLETLSGQRNGPMYSLLPHAWELWEQGRAMSLLDPTDTPEERPAMSAIVAMLTSNSSRIDRPVRPGIHGSRDRPPLHESGLLEPTTIDLR
ncbi:hypothetical protein E2562_004341 [Oryza meyeriana var. granulata]|uniref:non-specific serine/threonine protein kinase n=1 Tax=Oryza meyeriana var. granulata TaxID=110450 RepID=A0A6G1BSZ1_9ORYZ|nr:hypothetical protein E2562_004341 [Oryza meyeriana var. granulata]